MNKARWLLGCFALLFCLSGYAQLIETKGDLSTNDVASRSFKFKSEPGKILIQLSVNTRPGDVSFEVRSPDGRLLGKQSAGVATMDGWTLAVTNGGDCELVVTPHQTAGQWQVQINQIPSLSALYAQLASGALMMLVALASVFVWWFRSRIQWRWFWAGAGIWTVGVALKFAAALPLNPLFFGKTGHAVGLKLCTGAVYCGLMTGIFEIGITLAAALVWRRLAADPARAVAVGLGAGAFEALLLGLLAASAGSLVALAFGQSEVVLKSLAPIAAHTPLMWLAGPTERVIAMLAHTASRVLVLRAVAGRRWLGFWAGFGWLSGIDLLAGVALLTGMTTSSSLWLIELMILPFGVLSVPLILWAVRRWPIAPSPTADAIGLEAPAAQPVGVGNPEPRV
jgi:uncharacterized membrane protein YhfC